MHSLLPDQSYGRLQCLFLFSKEEKGIVRDVREERERERERERVGGKGQEHRCTFPGCLLQIDAHTIPVHCFLPPSFFTGEQKEMEEPRRKENVLIPFDQYRGLHLFDRHVGRGR